MKTSEKKEVLSVEKRFSLGVLLRLCPPPYLMTTGGSSRSFLFFGAVLLVVGGIIMLYRAWFHVKPRLDAMEHRVFQCAPRSDFERYFKRMQRHMNTRQTRGMQQLRDEVRAQTPEMIQQSLRQSLHQSLQQSLQQPLQLSMEGLREQVKELDGRVRGLQLQWEQGQVPPAFGDEGEKNREKTGMGGEGEKESPGEKRSSLRNKFIRKGTGE